MWKNTRHDKYFHLAKEQGYRARSAFKLIQLNKTYDFLTKARCVVDLCAAPGGWCQVAVKAMPMQSMVIGIDILPIKAIKGVITMQQDITTQLCRTELKKALSGWNVDVFLNDGAPNVGGGAGWVRDAYAQVELVLHALKLATEFLRPGGWFISKAFRSQDYNALLWCVRQFFKEVEVSKPASSRQASAEIFIVCKYYLAPKSIDPKLLDPAYVFNTVKEETKLPDVFTTKKGAQKKHRSGYEDDVGSLLFKKISIVDFVNSTDPIDVLGRHNMLTFDKSEECAFYLAQKETTTELKLYCEDLKLLGKGDFKRLLKWRAIVKAAWTEHNKEEDSEEEKTPAPELTEEEKEALQESRLTQELEKLSAKYVATKKREKKKKFTKLKRARKRKELGPGATIDDFEDGDHDDGPEGLFNLKGIKDDATLTAVATADYSSGSDSVLGEEEENESEYSGSDSEGARLFRLERLVDSSYAEFKIRRKILDKQRKKNAFNLDENSDELSSDSNDSDSDPYGEKLLGSDEEIGDDGMKRKKKPNKLLATFDEAVPVLPPKERVNRWFGQDAFKGIGDDLTLETSNTDKKQTPKKKTKLQMAAMSESSDSQDFDGSSEDEDKPDKKKASKVGGLGEFVKRMKTNDGTSKPVSTFNTASMDDDMEGDGKILKVKGAKPTKGRKMTPKDDDISKDNDYEEVPAQEDGDWSDYSDNSDAIAEVQALGTSMLRKKNKQAMIDAAYSRYTFGDDEELPVWFTNEETLHNRLNLPVTKDEVQAMKDHMRAINARPIKKIQEAQGRKKLRAIKKFEKIKNAAKGILGNDESTAVDKKRSLEKLYAKGGAEKRKKPQVVVGTKGGAKAVKGSGSGRLAHVDRRSKADAAGMKRAEKRNAKQKKNHHKKGARSR